MIRSNVKLLSSVHVKCLDCGEVSRRSISDLADTSTIVRQVGRSESIEAVNRHDELMIRIDKLLARAERKVKPFKSAQQALELIRESERITFSHSIVSTSVTVGRDCRCRACGGPVDWWDKWRQRWLQTRGRRRVCDSIEYAKLVRVGAITGKQSKAKLKRSRKRRLDCAR